jgi:hypothetical protein
MSSILICGQLNSIENQLRDSKCCAHKHANYTSKYITLVIAAESPREKIPNLQNYRVAKVKLLLEQVLYFIKNIFTTEGM